MNESTINYQQIFILSIMVIIVLFCSFIYSLFNHQTKIVFCDVGQGDASYIRIKNTIDVIIDTGPNQAILNCLGRYMPFYDRKIELVILTHPQKDHIGGFKYLNNRYKIDKTINVYDRLNSKKLVILSDTIEFLWSGLTNNRVYSSTDNDDCLILLLKEANFSILYTADASYQLLSRVIYQYSNIVKNTSILKVPHHGSKNGLNKTVLELANPKLAVISVGKNNQYGHPSSKVLDLLKTKNIKIKRTDVNGNVVIKLP